MKRHLILIALSIAIATLAAGAALAAGPKSETVPGPAAYNRLKTLVGEWEAETQMGKVHLTLGLIAGGTSLVERETGEKMPEMMTVYYLDGDRLLLTHYCMAGNQPRMQARSFNPETGEVEFQFLDATNLAGPGAGHMHNVRIRVGDNNHFASEWEFYENGQRKMAEAFQYTRVK
ncbi:MAG TPA: hypothetical protein VKR61_02750 [Bryobacteraceae bacterium]|nr:hypothetical protein [Bryobacteraceae bacterium]